MGNRSLRMPRFSYAIVASICESRDARSFDAYNYIFVLNFLPRVFRANTWLACG